MIFISYEKKETDKNQVMTLLFTSQQAEIKACKILHQWAS